MKLEKNIDDKKERTNEKQQMIKRTTSAKKREENGEKNAFIYTINGGGSCYLH
jgi:hypothetical protein